MAIKMDEGFFFKLPVPCFKLLNAVPASPSGIEGIITGTGIIPRETGMLIHFARELYPQYLGVFFSCSN